MKLPAGLAWVKFRQSQPVEGKIKNATVSQAAGHWYISFQVEQETSGQFTLRLNGRARCGIAKLATLSDGTVFEPVNSFKTNQTKLAGSNAS